MQLTVLRSRSIGFNELDASVPARIERVAVTIHRIVEAGEVPKKIITDSIKQTLAEG